MYHATAEPTTPAEAEQQTTGDLVYIERYAYSAKAAHRRGKKVPVWKLFCGGNHFASISRADYEDAGKYNVMRGTHAFESIRWLTGELLHTKRVPIRGHLERKVMDSCMGQLYYRGKGWQPCFAGTLSDSEPSLARAFRQSRPSCETIHFLTTSRWPISAA